MSHIPALPGTVFAAGQSDSRRRNCWKRESWPDRGERMKAANQKNTLLFRLGMWTTAVILVAVLGVGYASYANLEMEIRRNRETYYQQRFDYSVSIMEQQLFQPLIHAQEEVYILTTWKDYMRLLAGEMNSQIPIMKMNELLYQKRSLSQNIADIAVYSESNRFIVSGLSGVCFLDDATAREPFDREWVKQLDGMGAGYTLVWLPERAFPGGLGVEGNVFSLVTKTSFGQKDSRVAYLCLSVSASQFQQLSETNEGEHLFMTDASGQTMLGEGAFPEGHTVGSSLFREGDTFYMTTSSAHAPWYYVMTVPASQYTRYNDTLRSRTIIISALIFLIMTGVSYAVLRRMTSPFSAMLERAKALRLQEYDRKRSDMRFVADTFGQYIASSEAIRQQLDERRSDLRRSFLLALLNGKAMPAKERADYLKFLQLDFSLPIYAAVILARQGEDFDPQDELRVDGMLERLNTDDMSLFSAGAYGQCMYLIANLDREEQLDGLIEHLRAELSSSVFQWRAEAVAGMPVDSLRQLDESMIAARERLDREDIGEAIPLREAADGSSSLPEAHAQCAEAAALYLDEHYAEDIAVQEIADRLGVSRSHLSRAFKAAHGMTILEYLLGVRLAHAMRLLDETDLSITEISRQVGFNNSNYFFHKFKEKFNQTPSQYRSEKK